MSKGKNNFFKCHVEWQYLETEAVQLKGKQSYLNAAISGSSVHDADKTYTKEDGKIKYCFIPAGTIFSVSQVPDPAGLQK